MCRWRGPGQRPDPGNPAIGRRVAPQTSDPERDAGRRSRHCGPTVVGMSDLAAGDVGRGGATLLERLLGTAEPPRRYMRTDGRAFELEPRLSGSGACQPFRGGWFRFSLSESWSLVVFWGA